ncbi:MAG TPA: NAD(P)-dependent oxidoreductase [Candidatus Limnocylindrales bacterium]
MTTDERFLVTGSAGCLGAWVVRALLDEDVPVVALDLDDDPRRMRLLATEEELGKVDRVKGDVTDLALIDDLVVGRRITHIVHCAALQVPFVRARPALGSHVNVTGTIAIMEAAAAHPEQVRGVAYASAGGVFGLPAQYPDGLVRDDSPQAPATLYGVFKQANEGTARIYFNERGLSSVGLRPWVVYGPGRDQGMTSGTTVAMLAAAAGVPYRIPYGGEALFQFAPDVARAFVAAARADLTGANAYNLGGETAPVARVVDVIEEALPRSRGLITHDDVPLPAVARVDASGFGRFVDPAPFTGLPEGVGRSIELFTDLLRRGLVRAPA